MAKAMKPNGRKTCSKCGQVLPLAIRETLQRSVCVYPGCGRELVMGLGRPKKYCDVHLKEVRRAQFRQAARNRRAKQRKGKNG